jgi:hypothetical protein
MANKPRQNLRGYYYYLVFTIFVHKNYACIHIGLPSLIVLKHKLNQIVVITVKLNNLKVWRCTIILSKLLSKKYFNTFSSINNGII